MAVYYPEPDPHQFARGAWLTSAGSTHKHDGGGIHRPRGLERPACIFMTRGRLRYLTVLGQWRVRRDGLLWLLPGQEHEYWADPSSDEFWFICDGPRLRELFAERIRPEHPVTERADEASRHAAQRAWTALSEHHPRANEIATLAVEELLARHEAPGADQPTDDGLVVATLQHIEASLGQISPADIATALDVSYPQLRRRFRAARGESMVACCTRIRLRRAKELLAESELSITAVAETCGYDDPFFFARQFRKHMGSSPSAFRASCRLD